MIRYLWLALVVACLPLHGHGTHYSLRVEADGRIGGFRNGGGVIGWQPLHPGNNRVVFTQVAGGYYLDQYVATVGLGYRHVCNGCFGVGVNGFADFSRSTFSRKSYAQGGVGAELFGTSWDARINSYFPTPNQKRLDGGLALAFYPPMP